MNKNYFSIANLLACLFSYDLYANEINEVIQKLQGNKVTVQWQQGKRCRNLMLSALNERENEIDSYDSFTFKIKIEDYHAADVLHTGPIVSAYHAWGFRKVKFPYLIEGIKEKKGKWSIVSVIIERKKQYREKHLYT